MIRKKKMQDGGKVTVVKNKKGTTTKKGTSGGTTAVVKYQNDKGETTKLFGNNKTGLIYNSYGKGITTTIKDKNGKTKEIAYQSANPNKPVYKKTVKSKK